MADRNHYRDMIVKNYRERLLKTLVASDLATIFRDLGTPYPTGDALEARYYLLQNWSDDIRERVLRTIARNLEP